MIKKLLSAVIVASAMLTFTSCLNSTDEDITYYDDTAVTAFSLGTVNRILHTTASDGVTDSTYKVSYSASTYPFYIDQLQKLIYNADSLPYGTDATKLLCTITTKNSGTAVLVLKNQAGADSLAYYSATDSIDLSSPMRLRVFNLSGTAYREYTVTVNVHRQKGTEVSWTKTSHDALAAVSGRKLIFLGQQTFLFGQQGGQTVVYRHNGTTYERLAPTFDANAYQSVVTMNGYLYLTDNGSVKRSADGETWETTGTPAEPTRLIGAGSTKLYALTANAIVSSADNGATWTAESLDDDASMLPADNVNFVCMAVKTNAGTNKLVLIGRRDGHTRVWSKVEENAAGAQPAPWLFYNDDPHNILTLPLTDNLQVVAFDGGLLAIGDDFSTLYKSNDQGLTWQAYGDLTITADFGRTAAPFAVATDSTNTLYISKAGSPDIWAGRIARLGWGTAQQQYEE